MLKKSAIFLCLILFIGVIQASAYTASDEYIWETNNHKYMLVTVEAVNTLTWITAQETAQSFGGGWDLATITSEDEQYFVQNLLYNEGLLCTGDRTQLWIGGFQDPTDSHPADNWKWVTGEDWNWTNWGDNQGDNQPDDWGTTKGDGEQYYLALDSSFGWKWDDNTEHLQFTKGFLAEVAVPLPASILLLGTGLLAIIGIRRKFR